MDKKKNPLLWIHGFEKKVYYGFGYRSMIGYRSLNPYFLQLKRPSFKQFF